MTENKQDNWWSFSGETDGLATGEFRAEGFSAVGRLYFPLVNESGILSWTTPGLQGGPALSHNEYLSLPLSAEDLSCQLVNRDFWVVSEGQEPFSLAGRSPDELRAHLNPGDGKGASVVEAGPGWFRLTRKEETGRFAVQATLWCPADVKEPIELMRVKVSNTGSETLSFLPYSAVPVYARSADNFRDHRHVTALLHRVALQKHGVAVTPTMSFDERGHNVNRTVYAVLGFGPGAAVPEGIWAVQDDFLGEAGNYSAPQAVWQKQSAPDISSSDMQGREAVGAFRFARTELDPGASAEFLILSGITKEKKDLEKWARWAGQTSHWEESLQKTKDFWQEKVHKVSFAPADKDLANWLVWTNFQPQLRRLYGNSYLPQFDYGRGGRGWRDLWQDCLALLLSEPKQVRAMLLHNIGGVRIDGSNATIIGSDGSFIADRNNIPRTWMDHGAWPLHTILLYAHQTGDTNIFFEECPYFRDPQIFRCRKKDESWSEKDGYALKGANGKIYRGTVLEHMLVQTLTAFFNTGAHNLCRLEGADWNDGLDMAEKNGESVAFSAFYAWNLKRLAGLLDELDRKGEHSVGICKELTVLLDRLPRGQKVNYKSSSAKQKRLQKYLETVSARFSGKKVKVKCRDLIKDLNAKYEDLRERISDQEWLETKKGSFFNGYYDNDGKRVAGAYPKGLRMSLTGQVFPVLGNIATERQVDQTVRAVNRFLKDPSFGGVRLNTDFEAVQPRLGRAFFFAYGEKENGAVFSHMAMMYAYALYARRRPLVGRQAWHALYRMAMDRQNGRVFPNLPEYFNARGRGLYCYLTGSASWLEYLLLTRVFGVRGEWGDLIIDPQLTKEDFLDQTEVSVQSTFAQRSLLVRVQNPQRLEAGTYRVESLRTESADGTELPFEALPEGGARVSRRVVSRLPRTGTATLVVRLGR